VGDRVPVPVDVLDRDGRALVRVGGRAIAVFRVGEAVYAVENECPHERNPLIDGDIVGETLVCAYHQWRFDLATGACLFGDVPARSYRVEVREGAAWIELDSDA